MTNFVVVNSYSTYSNIHLNFFKIDNRFCFVTIYRLCDAFCFFKLENLKNPTTYNVTEIE